LCLTINATSRLPSLQPKIPHPQRAHRQRQTPRRPKHRAYQLGVVVVRALAKRLRFLVKHQPAARDDDVKSEKGQQGIGVEVHRCPLFCFPLEVSRRCFTPAGSHRVHQDPPGPRCSFGRPLGRRQRIRPLNLIDRCVTHLDASALVSSQRALAQSSF
jgi:hypothetical protein